MFVNFLLSTNSYQGTIRSLTFYELYILISMTTRIFLIYPRKLLGTLRLSNTKMAQFTIVLLRKKLTKNDNIFQIEKKNNWKVDWSHFGNFLLLKPWLTCILLQHAKFFNFKFSELIFIIATSKRRILNRYTKAGWFRTFRL